MGGGETTSASVSSSKKVKVETLNKDVFKIKDEGRKSKWVRVTSRESCGLKERGDVNIVPQMLSSSVLILHDPMNLFFLLHQPRSR